MKKQLYIPKKTREIVVSYCNKHIVPNQEYIEHPNHEHPIEWFKNYFSFIPDKSCQAHLADAYYQARFVYKIMQGLQLTSFKRHAFLKFQVQQYASIYEALIDFTLEKYHKKEIADILKEYEYKPVSALARNVEFTVTDGSMKNTIHTCKKVTRKINLKTTRISDRTEACVKLGIISKNIKRDLDNLYDIRNHIHILKAAQSNYRPTIKECLHAFELMNKIVTSIAKHIAKMESAV